MENMLDFCNESISLSTFVTKKVENILVPLGFEVYPFKVGWYNDRVDRPFRLDYDYHTLAVVIVSTPSMFEKAFKPFMCLQSCAKQLRDPLDQCVAHMFNLVTQQFNASEILCIPDFEMEHNRRPKVLVQTAGHVAGAARYYQRQDLKQDPWPSDQKIFGVSLHPRYGGWFALRGVVVFKTLTVPDLPRIEPAYVLSTDSELVELLERYNFHWRDWTFRDVLAPEERYSEEQKEYFQTLPGQRMGIIEKIVATATVNQVGS